MCYHSWYDDPPWPYWDDLYAAEHYIYNYVYRYSRCCLISKEKYGTIRYEYVFAPGGGYRARGNIKLPFFKRKAKYGDFDIYLFSWSNSIFYRIWVRWGKYILSKAVKSACLKFPNCKKEILDDYEPEYL